MGIGRPCRRLRAKTSTGRPSGRPADTRWWRGQDLNLRPSGYEPDELPGCSTPRHYGWPRRRRWHPPAWLSSPIRSGPGGRSALRNLRLRRPLPGKHKSRRSDQPAAAYGTRSKYDFDGNPVNIANGLLLTPPAKPGDDLLFHCLSSSTIGAVRFHGRVRDGIGWVTDAMVTKLW